MKYLVIVEDGRFAADAKARRFVREYPDAHKFDRAADAYHVAKMLNLGRELFGSARRPKAHAVSVKSYEENDLAFDLQHPHADARVRQAMGDATGADDQPS